MKTMIWVAFPAMAACVLLLCNNEGVSMTDANAAGAPEAATIPLEPIARADGPIVIDGRLDKPCWQKVKGIRADYIKSKAGELSPEPHMLVKYLYDDNYLYIGYETFDRNLVAVGTGKAKGPPDNQREGLEIDKAGVKVDVVEFFVSLGDRHCFWEFHHNALNQFNDLWITLLDKDWPIARSELYHYGIVFGPEKFLPDDGPYKTAMAVQLKPKADGKGSTVNDSNDEDTGYTAEIRLPWYGLGAPADRRTWVTKPDASGKPVRQVGPWKIAGQEVWILAVAQDGDLAERYHHSCPREIKSWFHTSVLDWPRYVLTETPAGGTTQPAK